MTATKEGKWYLENISWDILLIYISPVYTTLPDMS